MGFDSNLTPVATRGTAAFGTSALPSFFQARGVASRLADKPDPSPSEQQNCQTNQPCLIQINFSF